MAKPPKKAKSRSTTSAKQKNILTRIAGFARRNKALVFAVIIAVICGGWYTYRSFAATGLATVKMANLDSSSTTEQRSSTGKSGLRVARLTAGESVTWRVPGNTLKSGRIHQVCVTLRKESPTNNPNVDLSVNQVVGYVSASSGFKETTRRIVGHQDSYIRHCTKAFTGWGRDALDFKVTNRGPGDVRAAAAVVELY